MLFEIERLVMVIVSYEVVAGLMVSIACGDVLCQMLLFHKQIAEYNKLERLFLDNANGSKHIYCHFL